MNYQAIYESLLSMVTPTMPSLKCVLWAVGVWLLWSIGRFFDSGFKPGCGLSLSEWSDWAHVKRKQRIGHCLVFAIVIGAFITSIAVGILVLYMPWVGKHFRRSCVLMLTDFKSSRNGR